MYAYRVQEWSHEHSEAVQVDHASLVRFLGWLTQSHRELESKPKVVGVAWVVECAEQRSKVDEENFSVDLDVVHVPHFGTRRRRSMLPQPPKILPGDIGDLENSPGQASSSFESAIESETSTEGEDDFLREAQLSA